MLANRYNEFNPYNRPFVRDEGVNTSFIKDTMEFHNCVIFIQETDEDVSGESLALSNDPSKGKTVQLPKPPPDAPVVPGDGGSQQGKDLVFRVKSPLKLYHLSRLYDQYDGKYWRVSRSLSRTRDRQSKEELPWQYVKLSYFQEKLFSKTLAVP